MTNPLVDKTMELIRNYKFITGLAPTKIVVGKQAKETFEHLNILAFRYFHIGEDKLELPIILINELDDDSVFIRR